MYHLHLASIPCLHENNVVVTEFYRALNHLDPANITCLHENDVIVTEFHGALNHSYHMTLHLGVNKFDKPLVVYRFTGNVMTSITTLRT